MAQARSARAINRREKKRGSVTYTTDPENEVRYYISAGKETSQSEAEGSTATKNAVPKSQKLNLLGC